MNKLYSALLIGASALILSGCSVSDLAANKGGGAKPPPPQPPLAKVTDFDNDGKTSAGERAATAYTRTFAGGAAANVTEALTNGQLGGAGVTIGLGGGIAAASATTVFSKAAVGYDANKALKLSIDGQDYNVPLISNQQTGELGIGEVNINGQIYTYYGYTDIDLTKAANAGVAKGNIGAAYAGKYASLIIFAKGARADWSKSNLPHGGQDPSKITGGVDGIALIATGLETPLAGIPKQVANYEGIWAVGGLNGGNLANLNLKDLGLAGTGGGFKAVANFGAKKVDFTLHELGANPADNLFGKATGSASANIANGSQFVGTYDVTAVGAGWQNGDLVTSSVKSSGEIIGSFYGPSAEEVAGTLNGSVTKDGVTGAGAGGFFGVKQ